MSEGISIQLEVSSEHGLYSCPLPFIRRDITSLSTMPISKQKQTTNRKRRVVELRKQSIARKLTLKLIGKNETIRTIHRQTNVSTITIHRLKKLQERNDQNGLQHMLRESICRGRKPVLSNDEAETINECLKKLQSVVQLLTDIHSRKLFQECLPMEVMDESTVLHMKIPFKRTEHDQTKLHTKRLKTRRLQKQPLNNSLMQRNSSMLSSKSPRSILVFLKYQADCGI